MTTQPELFRAPKKPRAEEVERFCEFLAASGFVWVGGRTIGNWFQWSERKVRAVANASDGRIMSAPGSKGYCLTAEASAADREHIIAKFRHQSLAMEKRANAIARFHHNPQN